MGLDDAVEQGKEFLFKNAGTIMGALKSDQAETISDTILDGAAGLAKKAAPAAAEQIDGIRDKLDGVIGNE